MGLVQDLRGTIEDGVLANLLQYLALNQASGCLTLQSADAAYGMVYLDRGRVLHASTANAKGVPAIATMFTWRGGNFRFRGGEAPPEISIQLPLEHVLLEASQQVDEARRSGNQPGQAAPNANTILRRKEFSEQHGPIQIPANAIPLLAAMDGETALGALANRLGVSLEHLVPLAQELVRLNLAIGETPNTYVPAAFVTELTQNMIRIIGPVGEIIVEDALEDLNLSAKALSVEAIPILLREVFNQLKTDTQRQHLQTTSRTLRAKYRC